MPETLVAIPLYEPLIAGFPLYIVIIFGLVMILAFAAMLFKLEVYDRLEPVWGHREASHKNTPEAIVRGMSGKIWLMPVTSVAGIFSAMGLPLKWIQTVPTQGQLGKVNTIEVSDDWGIVHNIDIDYAIMESAEKWNEKHPEGTEGHIYDWDSYSEHLMNGDLDAMFPKGIKLPPLRNVNLHEIRRYLPRWTASHLEGFINEEINKRKGEDDNKGAGMMKWAILAAGVIILASVFGYVILTAIK